MFRSAARVAGVAAAARGFKTKALPVSPDADGLAEYSVVYTDRAVNHMSAKFQGTMNNLNNWLKEAYNAEATIMMPGSGTTGMEAVARQFATDKTALVVRNGLFSMRWTQIFDQGKIPSKHIVHKARRVGDGVQAPFAPAPLEEVIASIKAEKPAVVMAPHVETSAGIILPDEYIIECAKAVHEVGGIFVLDGIASGCAWIDMKKLDIDAYITAPQKGWTGPACVGIVMLGERGIDVMKKTQSTSFIADMNKWHAVMNAYINGGHMYHCTMPTDALITFENIMRESREKIGLDVLEKKQWELGRRTVAALEAHGANVVAADGFRAPSVVVAHTARADVQNGSAFKAVGMQVAGGVPLFVDEGDQFKSVRFGMLGIEKIMNGDATIATLEEALKAVGKF